MSVCLDYKDTVRIILPGVDGYGAELVDDEATVGALFGQNTGWSHGNNQAAITSDAFCYVDPSNEFVMDHFNRLEGMLVVAQLFGVGLADAWYRVVNVSVGRDSLLCNEIDNILLGLKKTTGIAGVS